MRSLFIAITAVWLARPATAQLTIRATIPQNTPAGATIHVAGPFNGWRAGGEGWVLTRQQDGAYAITLPDSVSGVVEFKLTRGSWETVETAADGSDVPNRSTMVMTGGRATFSVTVGGWRDLAPRPARRSTASASVRVVSDSFPIPQLGRTRRVWIYLPPDYATSTRRYPVLYLQDGQNVFDAATSFAGEWGVDESLDSLVAAGAPPAIVVAVDNGGDHRLSEYDPWPFADPRLGSGGGEGDAYVAFLAESLKPWIDQRYRTMGDAEHTGVMGSSAGGLIALYAALKRPDVFGRAGVFSCACWLADPRIYAFGRAAHPGTSPTRFYFVIGALEGTDGGPARDQRRMVDSLVAAGFPLGTAVRAEVRADGTHTEGFWRREFPAAFRWLFDR